MKTIKLKSLLILSTVALLAACNNATSSDVDSIKKSGYINIGVTEYEPMDYLNEEGDDYIGFDADLSKEFASSLGVKTRFVLINWDAKVMELNSKKIDLIWNGMTITDELKSNIDLSISYATNYQCVVTKSSNIANYTSSEYLKDKRIAVESGSAGEEAATDYKNLNRVKSQLDALLEVNAGTSDCAVIDITMANSVVGKNDFKDLAVVEATKIAFGKENFGVGARKGSNLTSKLNDFFKTSYTSGLLTTLSEKYQVAIDKESFK